MAFTGSILACAPASPVCLQRLSNGGPGSPVSRLTDLLEVLGLTFGSLLAFACTESLVEALARR
jgi:hypothetical protein